MQNFGPLDCSKPIHIDPSHELSVPSCSWFVWNYLVVFYSLSCLKKYQVLETVYLEGFDQLALQVEVNWTWRPVVEADVTDEIVRHWLSAKGKLLLLSILGLTQ